MITPLILGYLVENDATSLVSASAGTLKRHAASNSTVLKALVQLYQKYRGDDKQLTSKDSKNLMVTVMRSLAGGASQSSELGTVSWEPDNFVFVSFFDQVGDRPLGEFLGITDMSAIPDVDLEMKADAIRNAAEQEELETKKSLSPQKLLNSRLSRVFGGMPLNELYEK